MNLTQDQFHGCVLALALGDALGAPFEGGVPERLLWRIIGRTRSGEMRWTDDTQMSVDVIESLLAKATIDPDDLAARFAASYRWSRGYGPATSKALKRIARGADWRQANTSVYPEGSFGNGAAMRAPVIGLFYADNFARIDDATRQSAMVTHSHPLGIEGATIIARATAVAARAGSSLETLRSASECCTLPPFKSRLAIAEGWLTSNRDIAAPEIKRELGNGIAAHESCVTALYLALKFRDRAFVDLQRVVAKIGGDADTIGAMAGAIWGAANGAAQLPAELLAMLEQRKRLASLAEKLYRSATA